MPAPTTQYKQQQTQKKRNKKLIIFGVFVFLCLVLLGVLSYVAYRPSLRISSVVVTGAVLVPVPDIQKTTLEYLYGSYGFFLFPKSNSFIYPRADVERKLRDTFQRIGTVSVTLDNRTTLRVTVVERSPVGQWCDTKPADGPSAHCYFLDDLGLVFSEAPQFSGDAYFKYFGFVTKTENPIGEHYLASTTHFTELSRFVDSMREQSLRPQYVVLNDKQDFELVLAGDTTIYFDMNQPLSKTADNLTVLLSSPQMKRNEYGLLPVDYIDMRFGNKLFYKLK